ncbi:MAG TPA: heavy-metal-associated domain-containing protein [Thermoanaerobaculia bacterium]|nr:heavy-metal-associated domain-containing protein [Thermoanaerobaculia bacterium]
MRKNLLVILITITAALGVAGFASAGTGSCAIPQRTAAASTASQKVATLHIDGMTCGSCATAVKHVLTSMNGVKAATVSYEKKSAVVTYEPAKVTPDKLALAIEQKLPTYKARVIK